MMRLTLSLSDNPATTSVERAITEFRSARPVVIDGAKSSALVVGVEGLDDGTSAEIGAVVGGHAYLVLPPARLRRLGIERQVPGRVALPVVDRGRVEALALRVDGRIDATVRPADELDGEALELARLSLVLPAVIVVPLAAGIEIDPSLVRVSGEAIRSYRSAKAIDLKIVSRAPVPLEGAPTTEFVVFRGGEGLRDQVAIIVGKPDLSKPVLVRLHSACLTGDLFGSLKCDCGDQLRDTVRFMMDHEGGILLYLDQEGRGNGITNKIRAYKLQSQGYDTYDADEVLGFEADQRRFDFAAVMLKELGVSKVRLMTNNPEKIGALAKAGLAVISDHRVLGRPTAENVSYLASKRDRAGHYIDLEGMLPRCRRDAALPDVRGVLHLGHGRDEPPALRPAGAESELVAGYMVEYSSTPYLLFMLGEYVAIMTMCALGTILFLGGWLSPIPFAPFTWVPGVIWFVLKASFLFILIAMVKALVPRYRYDQLMRLGWKVFLPLSLAMVIIVAGVLMVTGAAPGMR
jgi:GTP cyclohydrolase II